MRAPWTVFLLASAIFSIDLQAAADYTRVVGSDKCLSCHSNEAEVWKNSRHFKTFEELHRKPRAKEIAEKLGISHIKSEGTCWGCHYTTQEVENKVQPVAGVSCEQCHGAADDWLTLHNDYGGRVKKNAEKPGHKAERYEQCAEMGMAWSRQIYELASQCFQCHTVPDEKLVNVGTHHAGSDFELVSWSQGEIRHAFYTDGSSKNYELSPERKRLFYVVGQSVDLEFSLRGTALATSAAEFGINRARRTKQAYDKLQEVQAKQKVAEIDEMLAACPHNPDGSLKLRLHDAAEMNAAADAVKAATKKFLMNHDGGDLSAIDPLIPGKDKYRGAYSPGPPEPPDVFAGPDPKTWYAKKTVPPKE